MYPHVVAQTRANGCNYKFTDCHVTAADMMGETTRWPSSNVHSSAELDFELLDKFSFGLEFAIYQCIARFARRCEARLSLKYSRWWVVLRKVDGKEGRGMGKCN
jgi:hypothetical protein